MAASLLPDSAQAQVAVTRTRFELPASNGYGAIILNLDAGDPGQSRRLVHFREHLYAVEEPQLDTRGHEIWNGGDFAAVYTRDLLFDAYFGLRDGGGQAWLTTVPVDFDASGYAGWQEGETGGTGLVTMVQTMGSLEATQYFFTPVELEANAFVMAMRVRNVGGNTVPDAQAFSLHNFHLGYGRAQSPWEVQQDIGENGETLLWDGSGGGAAYTERGFAGVMAVRATGNVAHYGAAPAVNVYAIVNDGGTTDLPDNPTPDMAVDGATGALQFDLGDLGPGQEAWVAVTVVHHGDPQAGAAALGLADAWIDGRDAQALVQDEIDGWADFQATVELPADLDSYEETLTRHSATMLRMGQVQEDESYLREWLTQDGEPRRTRFPSPDAPTALPGVVQHNGRGAVLASLPPGNWTYAWIRDGAYATVAMAVLGMVPEARAALEFYLEAEAGRFVDWSELDGYDMPDYQISLVRYYGFGVEETDFNAFGPNLEFDGFGLFLWALRAYEQQTGDEALAAEYWPVISERIADVLVALVDPATGLIRRDSSIWESHWEGRERYWAYTTITAVRGLCDAAAIADRLGEAEQAETYRSTALGLREAIVTQLTDSNGAIASNLEELESGQGYWDAAVIDAVAMGLFDPQGEIASATLAGLDANLLTPASEVGWARNDDDTDHEGASDLSPWGSVYDAVEWVITDLRGTMAWRGAGDEGRADAILQWILAQSLANYLMVAETFDANTGTYENNTPMLGFGAGAWALALAHREGEFQDAACGEFWEGGDGGTGGDDTSGDETAGDGGTATSGAADSTGQDDDGETQGMSGNITSEGDGVTDPGFTGAGSESGGTGCSCTTTGEGTGGFGALILGLLGLGWRRRRRVLALAGATAMLGGCADDAPTPAGGTGTGEAATTLPLSGNTETTDTPPTTGLDDTTTAVDPTGGGEDITPVELCPTEFTFSPSGSVSNVRLVHEAQSFDLATAVAMKEAGGGYEATVDLPIGLNAYKFVYDQGGEQNWVFDPEQARRKYVDGVENSGVLVPDCNLPQLHVQTSESGYEGPDAGTYDAQLSYRDGFHAFGADPDAYEIVLRHASTERALLPEEITIEESGDVTLSLSGLEDGKHTVVLVPVDQRSQRGEPVRLVFWAEAEPFSWEDALVYMVVTDRYRNGDPSNDGPVTPGADGPGDWFGGDLEGLRLSIAEGELDALGVRAIWLTPWQTNPVGGYAAADGIHTVTGYHGYWPTRAREVDPRLGGEEALRALVDEAHAHGIRILQDYVINHVHEEHEYVAEHPDWFRTGCVCGGDGCGWTEAALYCLFQPYMPDIDHSVPEANAQFVEDAVWWVDEFDLDGLRVDAVKHVEEVATRNISAAIRETFEQSGAHYFLMGETAMGWNNCADPCNDENYETIARYVGPHGLDGQFDFVLYHAASYGVFGYSDYGMIHADYWFNHGQGKWPEGSIMTPYIGSHDTPRFSTLADYRGQDPGHDRGIAHVQWGDIAQAPGDDEPYWRTRVGFAWLLGLPGAPLLYYGDEYGQWGGADPNNRMMWRPPGELNAWETETLAFVRTLGQLRQQIQPLRRGRYVGLWATEDALLFGRMEDPGEAAIVGVSRAATAQEHTFSVVSLGFLPGTMLSDALGGPGAMVAGDGTVTVTVPARGAVILVP
ncbi:MAG: alpha-amylase family glycosyl hydrolase [Myxococcota bacterium]